jgi:hypothetical protein
MIEADAEGIIDDDNPDHWSGKGTLGLVEALDIEAGTAPDDPPIEGMREGPSGVIFWMVTWTSGIEDVDAVRLPDL